MRTVAKQKATREICALSSVFSYVPFVAGDINNRLKKKEKTAWLTK